VITLESVSYRYAGAARASIRDVSVGLHDGEVLGLVGASEAGKSTVCLVASGLAPRTIAGSLVGRVLIDGADVAGRPMHALAQDVAIAFQNPSTQLSRVTTTVYEEVAFGPMNLGLPRIEVLRRTEEAIDTLAINDLAPRDPSHLSGGQQQLVAIAGLLAMAPRHLILDEPTAQLDPAGSALVSGALTRLAASGQSILVVEQKVDLLSLICHNVVVMDGGTVVMSGAARDVLGNPRLRDLGVAEPSDVRLRRLAADAKIPVAALENAIAAADDPR
jgi:energy-coupling factor transporter ATP-binding protein EcfA2